MGRLIDFHEVMAAILPEMQTRWRRSLARWTGEISLTVDGQVCVLHIDGANIQYVLRPGAAAYHLELTPQALVQSIFGYRQLSSLTGVSHLPEEARSALSILFPTGHTWLPASDWF